MPSSPRKTRRPPVTDRPNHRTTLRLYRGAFGDFQYSAEPGDDTTAGILLADCLEGIRKWEAR